MTFIQFNGTSRRLVCINEVLRAITSPARNQSFLVRTLAIANKPRLRNTVMHQVMLGLKCTVAWWARRISKEGAKETGQGTYAYAYKGIHLLEL